MDTLVKCELAIKGACRIYWCLHYSEHPPIACDEEEKPCTAPQECESMNTTVRCKLITEN